MTLRGSCGWAARHPAAISDLPICSFYVLIHGMTRIDPDRVARALLDAPGWARVGLTAPTETIREAAAQELALTIARIDGEVAAADPNQLVLAL